MHVIQNLNYGGMERLLADIVRRLPREKFSSHVLTLEYVGRFGEGLDQVAELHMVQPARAVSLVYPRAMVKLMRRVRPDVVHSHSGVWYKASLAARLAGVRRVVHTEHGRLIPDPWTSRAIDSLAARRTDVVVAVSEPLADYLRRHIVRRPERIRLVRNGVDTALYRRRAAAGAARARLGLPEDRPVIGSIGRLEFIKGYDVSIEAMAALPGMKLDGPRPLLVLAGDGSEKAKLAARVAELGIGDDVRLLGWRDDVHDLHDSFTIFTMSSRSEGTSVSLLEAMSAGLCPVVTDVGGNRMVLGEELAHRLVPPLDPAALARAWQAALADPARRERDGEKARERVIHAFNLDDMVNAYAAIYAA